MHFFRCPLHGEKSLLSHIICLKRQRELAGTNYGGKMTISGCWTSEEANGIVLDTRWERGMIALRWQTDTPRSYGEDLGDGSNETKIRKKDMEKETWTAGSITAGGRWMWQHKTELDWDNWSMAYTLHWERQGTRRIKVTHGHRRI